MVRTQIQLTEQQARAVKAIAAAQGISVAEAIRRAIDLMTQSRSAMDTEERRRRGRDVSWSTAETNWVRASACPQSRP